MSVTPQQLKTPQGELEPEWFPLGDIDGRLNAWLDEATARVANLSASIRDASIKAYCYWKAYEAIYRRMLASPKAITVDSGKTESEYDVRQMMAFGQLADRYQTEFQGYFQTSSSSVAAKQISSCGVTAPPDVGTLKL